MDYTALIADIRAALPGLSLRAGEPMSRHCSFRVGGPAAAMAFPASREELAALCALLRQKGERPLVIGRGTNILPPDEGLNRIVVNTSRGLGDISRSGNRLTAQCGASLASLANAAAEAGLSGLEFAHGIPGTVGGGIVMNAGAYGGELKDAAVRTEYLDGELRLCQAEGAAQDLSYRHSFLSGRDWVALSVTFALTPGEREEIFARMRELDGRRRDSQPLDMPSAGSAFKRPREGYAAALIDQAGLKGFSVGGAQVSTKHAGFVVNTGGATSADVLGLMEHIQKTVLAQSGVLLEPEIRILRNGEG
ncbi:MAG: UDP-N-acetylmuramate dehydrogenase [Oscillospiraceae bacterium]|nr:UDP-N-acetylmuramate dehydrogenase [Oscillospiraceae bacterium]